MMRDENYGIRDGYQHRRAPAYFVDNQLDGKRWQPDVIPIAVYLARLNGLKTLVDIGCGRGLGLTPYAPEFDLVGIDYGANIEYCQEQHTVGRWMDCDLDASIPAVDGETLKSAALICADVIEHLIAPDQLVLSLKAMLCCAPFCVLSTPDRKRTYAYDHSGMPENPHHVREWTLNEMIGWLKQYGLAVGWQGWTRSNDVDNKKHTLLLVLSRANREYTIGELQGVFEVESAT